MNSERLAERVLVYMKERAGDLGLSSELLGVDYVLNWSGFVNYSFTVSDGARSYHLKVTSDDKNRAELRRWHANAEVLSARFHAPAILDVHLHGP